MTKLFRLPMHEEINYAVNLARPEGRALPHLRLPHATPSAVSILARPFERALRLCWAVVCRHIIVSILARPFERALPTGILLSTPCLWFQSSPALSSGRYRRSDLSVRSRCCFNPRPPFRAGATTATLTLDAAYVVSILARPFERALLISARGNFGLAMFQSSPALSSGRYFARWEKADGSLMFQSSPALSSGRY